MWSFYTTQVALLQSETVAKDRELKLLMEKLNDTLSAAMLKEDTTRKAHEQEVNIKTDFYIY